MQFDLCLFEVWAFRVLLYISRVMGTYIVGTHDDSFLYFEYPYCVLRGT